MHKLKINSRNRILLIIPFSAENTIGEHDQRMSHCDKSHKNELLSTLQADHSNQIDIRPVIQRPISAATGSDAKNRASPETAAHWSALPMHAI